jgi:AbrB family looped-hinge helix DNA binding protein
VDEETARIRNDGWRGFLLTDKIINPDYRWFIPPEKILTLTHSIDKINVIRTSDRWKNAVTAVTVSPKFQVVIPKDVRESMGIKSGQKVQVMLYKNRIELIPLLPIEQLRGLAKGINAPFKRDEDRL